MVSRKQQHFNFFLSPILILLLFDLQIDEVANQIFIRPALVKAIESGDWETLPEPVFVQGFLRRYAEFLGLDGREISKQFEPTPVSVLPDPQLAANGGVDGIINKQVKHGLKVLSKAEVSSNGSASPLSQAESSGNWRGWLLALLAIAAIIAGGVWAGTRNAPQPGNAIEESDDPALTTDPEPTTSPSSEVEVTSPAAEESAEAPSEPATTVDPNAAPITFEVNLEGDAWMRVTADGEEVYEGTLTSGTQQAWTAQQELTVTAGNSGAVLYSFNGSEQAPLGEPGAVRNLTLTPDTDPQALPSQ